MPYTICHTPFVTATRQHGNTAAPPEGSRQHRRTPFAVTRHPSLFTMRHELVMPEFGLGEGHVTISLWLVEVGDAVTEGDRVVELLSDSVTVDLPAPASGVLTEMLVTEDDPVRTGQVLCVIESVDE